MSGLDRVSRPGVVLPVGIDPTGQAGPTRMQARGRRWRRVSRGRYVPVGVDGSRPEQRIVEAADVLPAYGAVTGWAALRWAGGFWFDGLTAGGTSEQPVALAVAHHDIRPQPGIEVSQEHLDRRDLTTLDGLPLTIAERSLLFEMRHARSDRDAVVAFGMAAYNDLVSSEELTCFLDRHRGWSGTPRTRRAMDLADENWWSPQEVRMHLTWRIDADLPKALSNHPVFDRVGRHIGTPDLLDPVAGVAGQYDGGLHLEGTQRLRDRAIEEAYRRVGLEYFTILGGDFGDRGRTVDRMLQTRSRARFAAESRREWTIELPPWWIPTFTVDQRRNLTTSDRERLLRYRRTA